MAWFYEIRDQKGVLVKTEGGYKTTDDALAAGKAEARALKEADALSGSGFGSVTTGQNSEDPTR
jgi:hypothetical protein